MDCSWKSVEYGVIQGSVLGPVLFLIFISDINEVLPQGVDLQKYADDILTYIIGRTITQDLPQQIVDSISKWCQTNKMRLNTNKCKVMIINKKVSSNLPSVELNNNTLEEVSSYKYLGVELTNTLCWDEQWHRVQKQTSSIPYLIKRLKQLGFREEILVGVYRSLGLSHFTYSAPILSSTSIKTKSEMAQLQNRIFKIIGISPELALTKYNIQTIEELIEKTCTKLLRRILADEIHPLSMKLSKSTRKSYYKTNKARTAAYSNSFVQKTLRIIRDGTSDLYIMKGNSNNSTKRLEALKTKSENKITTTTTSKEQKPRTNCTFCSNSYIAGSGLSIHLNRCKTRNANKK